MPKFEPKTIQKDLESGKIWPVYWIYGGEPMKSREITKRIRKAALGLKDDDSSQSDQSFSAAFNETHLDAQECDVGTVLDAAQSLALGGGTRFVIVKQAHLLKQPEALERVLGRPAEKGESLSSVTVLLSKDLDQRKKFSKILIEKAAVVECAEIEDQDREPWIQYLAKRKGLTLLPKEIELLRVMDPWSLDSVDRELEKLELASPEERSEVLLGGVQVAGGDEFIEAFFSRNKSSSLSMVRTFSDQPEISLPLLGLLSWNVRMLGLVLKDREAGTREAKLGSFMMEKFNRFMRAWSLSEIAELQKSLREIDFTIKQTSKLPLGAWSELVTRFCR